MSEQTVAISPSRLLPSRWWLFAGVALLLLGVNYFEGIQRMVSDWLESEEYSHGILLPFISAYLIWQLRDQAREFVGRGHWTGIVVVVVSLLINFAAMYGSLFALQQYSLVITLYGLVVCIGGWRLMRTILAPMLMLLLMVPLPNFFLNNISSQLQLISSQLGVMFIRLAGVSVFLEGNIIDLGHYKLEVAEACSGLRYLFPLLTMACVMAYLFKAAWWKRAILIVSSIPLTIVMNSFRIGAIGVLVDHWGQSMAEGFLHQFQGWVVFMLSTGMLFLEVVLLSKLGGQTWRRQFGLRAAPKRDDRQVMPSPFNRVVWMALLLMMVAVPAVYAVPKQTEIIPRREYFNSFPLQIGEWRGQRLKMEQDYSEGLKLDDYLLADYSAVNNYPVNFYVAWYDSQQAGHSAHSPRSCLPGGGWHIHSLEQTVITDVGGHPLHVNRVILEYGDQKQLVYYWFQQRGRDIASEYMVKWYLFWDSLTRHRSDGALVRAIIPIPQGAAVKTADAQLTKFVREAVPKLSPYIPD